MVAASLSPKSPFQSSFYVKFHFWEICVMLIYLGLPSCLKNAMIFSEKEKRKIKALEAIKEPADIQRFLLSRR